MASFLDKFKVTTALDTNCNMDLSCTHITTSDWLHMSPVYIKEMVPGETLRVHQETFSRMAAMPTPTFGRGLIHNRAFFVPMRTLFKKWNEFITSTEINADAYASGTSVSMNVARVPQVANVDLVRLFCCSGNTDDTTNTEWATKLTATADSATNKTDIELVVFTGTTSAQTANVYYNLTNKGRRLMKILQSLGYQIQWSLYVGSYEDPDVELKVYSAMPLLAWLRILIDWYYSSAYVGDADYNYVKSILDAQVGANGGYRLSRFDLTSIFATDSIFNGLANYDSDYFVSAFDYPNSPSEGNWVGGTAIKDINFNDARDGSQGLVGNNLASQTQYAKANGPVPVYQAQGGAAAAPYTKYITQYGLDALKALTDYTKRHQLVGARALDRFYARFGKALDSAKLDRCNYIGAQNVPLQFGDVMSHSDTTGATLGSYAGKGLAYGADGNYEFSTDEYGFFVIVSSIIPQIGYYQGLDRSVLHLGRTDFWTPEFDQLGNQAISKAELYMPMNLFGEIGSKNSASGFANTDQIAGIFGYTPRYSEYKVARDRLTGDFRLNSKKYGDTSAAWHLMRNMAHLSNASSGITHSRYFTTGADWAQYNRIFAFNPDDANISDADKFYLIHTFNVESSAPMHSLYDTYKFENEDEGAKKVVADVNGVKIN